MAKPCSSQNTGVFNSKYHLDTFRQQQMGQVELRRLMLVEI